MKKLMSIVTVIIFAVTFSVNAQKPMHQKKSVAEIVQNMNAQLNLSDEQQKRVTEILKSRKAKMQAAKAEDKGDKTELKKVKMETLAEINKVLTAEQRVKWDAYKKEQAANQQNQGVEKRIDHLKKELNLTDAQVATIKPILNKHQANMQKIKEKHAGNDEAKKQEMKAERTRFKAELNKTLTPAQQAKLKEMKKNHNGKGKK